MDQFTVPDTASSAEAQGGNTWKLAAAGGAGILLLVGLVVAIVLFAKGAGSSDPTDDPGIEAPADFAGGPSPQQRQVMAAVAKGVAYLRDQLLEGETEYYFNDPEAGSTVGTVALAGLTLLECDTPSTDPAIEKAIAKVRGAAPRVKFTYSVCLSLMFLDRLRECTDRARSPNDQALIQQLALQLMAAQNQQGGWPYYCPQLTAKQEQELRAQLDRGSFAPGQSTEAYDDNSINQFATLALWVARKHGVKTEPALALVEKRFRANQNADGSWGYRSGDDKYLKDGTTCAGLIGLAVGRAARDESKAGVAQTKDEPFAQDPAVKKGLDFVGRALQRTPIKLSAEEVAKRRRHAAEVMTLYKRWHEAPAERPGIETDIERLDNAELLRGTMIDADAWGDLYFLWSVERVGLVYSMNVIGGRNWHQWGMPILLSKQKIDGSWRDRFPGIPDTCFALLFLKRANIFKDLTDKLQLIAQGQATANNPPAPGNGRKEP